MDTCQTSTGELSESCVCRCLYFAHWLLWFSYVQELWFMGCQKSYYCLMFIPGHCGYTLSRSAPLWGGDHAREGIYCYIGLFDKGIESFLALFFIIWVIEKCLFRRALGTGSFSKRNHTWRKIPRILWFYNCLIMSTIAKVQVRNHVFAEEKLSVRSLLMALSDS